MSEFVAKDTGLIQEKTRIDGTTQWGSGSEVFKIDKKQGIFIGSDNYTDAPFKITWNGIINALSLVLSGGSISYGKTSFDDSTNAGYFMSSDGLYYGSASDGKYIKYKISDGSFLLNGLSASNVLLSSLSAGSLLNIQGWQFNGTFSATDQDTVAWTAGTITLADGTTFSIDAGNTGNMSAVNYIYFDKGVSETVLQKTTTAGTAVGANKILIAVAQNNAATGKLATFQVFGGTGGIGTFITADNIAASTITANEIATNTITANKMSVSTLSAISADLGTITAGTVTGAIIQTATSGYRIKLNYSDNTLNFLSDDTVLTTMSCDASNSMVLASGGLIKFDLGTDSQTWYMSSSGFYPLTDKTGNLGSSSKEWNNIYSRDYHSGSYTGMDLSFTFDAGESHSFQFVSGLLVAHSKL
jgi:hypothetical protein